MPSAPPNGQSRNIPYTLIRSKRKTVSIHILPSGGIEVRAPLRAPVKAIEGFLHEKREWICLHVQRNRELYRQKETSLEQFPRELPFLGAYLPVKAVSYKHLDVYKRQACLFLSRYRAAEACGTAESP